ncbi:MAG: hypothetical protein JST51_09605 [Armatimonadetes bacterium]|nr:hypothetical protein [Armatimonadota bacterium]
MTIQEYLADVTRSAAQEAFRYAKAVPADKLTWEPDGARSVISLCWEMAMCPTWAQDLIENREEGDSSGGALDPAQPLSVAEYETECLARVEKLAQLFGTLSDERLKDTKWLPYNGGRDHTVLEMMDYPRWNFNYHLGQIAYVQTMLGDKEMH